MKLKFFTRLGVIFLAVFSASAALGQTYTFTSAMFAHQYNINGSGPNPTVHLTGGTGVTLNISTTDPLFLTATSNPSSSSQNYYAVNPGAFNNGGMASPTTSASVVFTPAISNFTYNIYYVNGTYGNFGTLEIDPPTLYPDTTSTISISRANVPTNGTAIVTIVPKNSGNVISTSSSAFVPSVSSGGGSVGPLSPANGTSFTATYTASTNAGAYSISDGLGASVAVSVLKSFLPASFTVSYAPGGQPHLTVQGFTNVAYQVLASTNFLSWTNLGTATSSATGLWLFTDTNSPFPAKRFYRLAYP